MWLELELKGSEGESDNFSIIPYPSLPNHSAIYAFPEGCLWCLFKFGQLSLRRGINSEVHILWSLARGTLAGAMVFEWLFTYATYSMANVFFALLALQSTGY